MNNTKGLSRAKGTVLGEHLVCQYIHIIDSAGFLFGDDPMDYSTPILFADISAGIILGPSVLGLYREYTEALFPPGSRLVLSTFVEIAFMFHLFILGLQINASLIKCIGRKALIIGLVGTMTPLAFGGTAYKNILQRTNPSEYRGLGPLMLAGIILGPSVLGLYREYTEALFPPGSRLVLSTFVEIAFMFHLFILGLQINASLIKCIGRKALIIGLVGTMTPLAFGGTAYKNILQRTNPSEYRGLGPLMLVTINSMTSFIDITSLLDNLNILNSEIGQFASSISLVSDACCWFLAFVVRNVGAALKYTPTKPLPTLVLVPL
ncbi:cation/h(+) antiporter 14 [Quercus suber]|uniref:Cation/h(+) antiporter 14 n=1 Tax=Quercus suber TaxID=58331 RepID=A0AAW0JZJ1_QUESU